MVWKNDLTFGQYYEDLSLQQLTYDTFETSQDKGKFKEWDFKITHNTQVIKYETKADRFTYSTDNICIEYDCNFTPSGITTTTADFWFIWEVFPTKDRSRDVCYLIPVKFIKQMIEDDEYHYDGTFGDGGRAYCYLFEKQLFNDYIITTTSR